MCPGDRDCGIGFCGEGTPLPTPLPGGAPRREVLVGGSAWPGVVSPRGRLAPRDFGGRFCAAWGRALGTTVKRCRIGRGCGSGSGHREGVARREFWPRAGGESTSLRGESAPCVPAIETAESVSVGRGHPSPRPSPAALRAAKSWWAVLRGLGSSLPGGAWRREILVGGSARPGVVRFGRIAAFRHCGKAGSEGAFRPHREDLSRGFVARSSRLSFRLVSGGPASQPLRP